VFLLGASLGGCIAVNAAHRHVSYGLNHLTGHQASHYDCVAVA